MVYTPTDDRDFTVKNVDALFQGRTTPLSGATNMFGSRNGYVKVIQLISYQESAIRAKGNSG